MLKKPNKIVFYSNLKEGHNFRKKFHFFMENGPEVKIKRMMKYLIEVDKNTHGVYFVFI